MVARRPWLSGGWIPGLEEEAKAQHGGAQGRWRRGTVGREGEKPLRGWAFKKKNSMKIDFQCDHYFDVYFGTTFTFIYW